MARLILGSGDRFTIGAGSSTTEVFGTSASETLTIAVGASVVLDASFNRGGDVITLAGNASSYSAVRSGSSVVLTDASGGSITVPVGTVGATIAFADASRSLVFDTLSSSIKLGSDSITTNKVTLSAGTGGAGSSSFTITAGDIETANALNGGAGAPIVKFVGNSGSVTVTVNSNAVTATKGIILEGNANLTITAGLLADKITVDGSGTNVINGGDGRDTLIGGSGNDTFVVGDGEFDAGVIDGGLGTDALEFSGTNDFSTGTLTSIENLKLNSTGTFTAAQLNAMTGTIVGDGKSVIIIKDAADAVVGKVDLAGQLSGIAQLTLGQNVTLTVKSVDLAGLAKLTVDPTAKLVTDVAGAVAIRALAPTVAFDIVDTAANVAAAPAAVLTAVGSIELGNASVAQVQSYLDAGIAGGKLNYVLVDSPANIVKANAAVLQNADGVAPTSTVTAAEAVVISGVGGLASAKVYTVTDTAANLANNAAGLQNAKAVIATTVANANQAAAIFAAAAGGNATTLSYDVNDTVAAIVAIAGPALNGATNVTATGNATVAQATTIYNATNVGSTVYNISDTAGVILQTANLAVVNAATNVAATGALVSEAAAIEALRNSGASSYTIVDALLCNV